MPGNIAGLLLDFGGVISITLFERHRLTEQILGLPAGTLKWRGPFDPGADELWREMLANRVSERDYWARRAHEVGRHFGENWNMRDLISRTQGADPNLHIRPEAEDTVRRAKSAGIRVGVLSNELKLFYGAEMLASLRILKEMDGIVDATHTKVLKPDAGAYALGCQMLNLPPERVLFVDDQPRNAVGAQAAGLHVQAFDVTRPRVAVVENCLGLR